MRSHVRIFAVLFFVLFHSVITAQFNTITRSPERSDNIFKGIEKDQSKPEEKYPKTRFRILNSGKKADLQKEIDSLKVLLSRSQGLKMDVGKMDFKKIEDSLIKTIREKVKQLIPVYSPGKPILKSEMIEDAFNDARLYVKIAMPLGNKLRITSGFGTRIHPLSGRFKMHKGVDLKANYENVYSVMNGYVMASGWDRNGGGNYLRIKHSESFVTSYLHLSKIYYRPGEFVTAGYIIGKSGSSGNSTGPHLHFSVTENGKHINPIHFLNDLIKANNLISNHNIL